MTTSTLNAEPPVTSRQVLVNGMPISEFKRFCAQLRQQRAHVAEAYRRQASRHAITVA